MINIEQLKQDLETLIAGLDDESTAEDLLALVASIDSLTEDRIVSSVADVDSLPNLWETNLPSGNIFFVETISALVISVKYRWLGLDRRVLRDDTVFFDATAWGYNQYGRLGDGTTIHRSSPVLVVGGITNWIQVSGGGAHSLGVTDDGIAYAWGNNNEGQLGDGTRFNANKSSPVTVLGGITNWRQVSGGTIHSLGLTDDGIAYAWGNGSFGRLGRGHTLARSSPVSVVGGITNWRQVSAGGAHSLGLTDDGIAYAWGAGISGRLGDGTTISRSSPVTVIGNITNWSQVSAGGGHSLGLTDDGIAYVWGAGYFGQLGDGTTISKSSPVTVIGGITNWSQLSAGNTHSLGLTDDGVAYAWGNNNSSSLGDGTTTPRSSPVTVIGGITNWSQLSGGGEHSLGLTDDGIAYAWGNHNEGQLGDGTIINRSSPVTVIGGTTNWSQLSAGGNHSLGIIID